MHKCHCESKPDCDCPEQAVYLKDVSMRRGDRLVLENATFCVDAGLFVGIIGPNGGGKTTIVKIILGLLKPTSGRVEIFHTPIEQLGARRAEIGYVSQRPDAAAQFPATALDVVLMAEPRRTGLLRRIPSDARGRAMSLLERTGVADLWDRPIGQMSGGQQQRTFLARALMSHPRILILDEPTSGLDSEGQLQFLHFVRELQQQEKLTVLMVSHDVQQLAKYSDQIVCVNGRIHWHDRSEALTSDVVQHVYSCELDHYKERMAELQA